MFFLSFYTANTIRFAYEGLSGGGIGVQQAVLVVGVWDILGALPYRAV
jgi:hypothetical protein